MKKMILITIVILSALFLVAAYAVPSPQQKIEGTLRWTHNSTCGLPDYLSTDTLGMKNVYLTGIGFPTHGEFQGCHIWARGTLSPSNLLVEGCPVFWVQSFRLACPTRIKISR